MHPPRSAALVLCLLLVPTSARAGLYYSGETLAELPSQWRGFLLDQRRLRLVAVRPVGKARAGPDRVRYQVEAERLARAARARKLSADEAADLGALYVRLGETGKALEILRSAQRDNPGHFRLAANLGTAWQLQGDLNQAAVCLRQAVRLAPAKLKKVEELHLKLVRLRSREPRGSQALDDLFGIRFVGPDGKFAAGILAEAQRKKLPEDAIALVQQLALALPTDARLLWLLAELAAVQGDVATASAALDGCVTEFALRAPDLLAHRQALRTEADKRKQNPRPDHEGHAALLKPRSARPLVQHMDTNALPPIDPKGINALPWSVVGETTVDRRYRPTFSKYLEQLNGKRVRLSGFMQPLGEDSELAAFMLIEYPVGCWYCETPDTVNIVLVEMPMDKTCELSRGLVHITGKLTLNATDPENFLYIIRDAKVVAEED